ncbi:amidohydrolase family protein [Photorhabdus temperata]|uniref:Putative TIM-barrel fold metal-dependent hydrolase n=1 Tax=Photorhabdus temperata subsp. temperata Meg1 TaxID=1393735 RepID=A0A081RYX7_PHOTE|nr:amidohydrolase family protein [Photorhabdus temperata]KER03880.1 putative TIM-barrel fold metal-dependent hydrolase [Photorhabdus temperata subsp. temperata Meg1]MCT8346935.1 amidohydrolase family protein [Photorhabdus temperata]
MREFDVNVFDAHIHTEFDGRSDHFSGVECSLASYKESIADIRFIGSLSDSASPSKEHGDLSQLGIYHCAVVRSLDYDLTSISQSLSSGEKLAIKINVGFIHRYASDDIFQPLYSLASMLKIPVMFHSGDPGWPHAKIKYADPVSLDEIAVDYPDVNFVLVHAGNPWFRSAAAVASKNTNVFLEGSSLIDGDLRTHSDERANRLISKPLSWMLDYLGTSRKLIFGSGWPMVHLGSYIDAFSKGLPEEAWEDVFCNNALGLYGLRIAQEESGRLVRAVKN